MSQTHKKSFFITLGLIFLLPIFFIPGGALSLDVAKSALLVLGIVVAGLVFLFETWQKGTLDTPWHLFVLAAILLPAVYLLSALLSTPSSLSLLGYNFEVGTFGFMFLGSALLVLVAMIFKDTSRVLPVLVAMVLSIAVIALFMSIKIIFGGDILVWGNFLGNMGNPIGNWTDLAIFLGLLSTLTVLALGMIPMKAFIRVVVYITFVLATLLLIITNFSTAFVLTLISSVFLFFYFLKKEKHFLSTASTSPQTSRNFLLKPTFLPIVLAVVSLVFLINPTIPTTQGTIGDKVATIFKVNNFDVRPSLSATLGISKAVLSQGGFLGSGPNTFGRDWLIHKPIDINFTPFWAVAFPFGVGFIPTQIASIGILGVVIWLAFFTLLIILSVKALSRIPESRSERFALVSVLLGTFFLWTASFIYTPSITVLMFAFIFSGLFVALACGLGIVFSRTFDLKQSPRIRFSSLFIILVIGLATLFIGWVGFEKTASAFHFKKAVDLSNTEGASLAEIESALNKAIAFSPADVHYVALSRINFAKAQVATNSVTGTPEENRAVFEESLRKSIEAARIAVVANSAGYQNWISLGMIYSSLVSEPLSVEGAYENAFYAYSEARKINPNNPELSLHLARLELNRGDREAARSFIRGSIALKEDYAEAYLMLAQLEIEAGNINEAIASAERLALLRPNNPGVYFELGLLKYSNKDYAGAAEVFNLALVSAPDYANAQYYLGLTLIELGQLDKAREQFEALLITNPDSAEVQFILEQLKTGENSGR